ncbi:cytidine deaminase [Rhodoplanes elegans]|uniref:Cytidine deaminase n=1 Tax=Rhodoplanes elegans TaxID=29408 RepID=A0A327JMN4_9BRAD|nr:cytidine deaminase [Rhodoplanes elegans]MBK5959324.1 cytidine deaminase [Rhodoplanes elegans]RAI27311.1 cytidine deaminase [Rhodoplanes elegans]
MDARATALSAQDQELIDAACEAIKRRYRNDWQEVGAALRSRTGQIITGVNLDAYLGRMAVCAEAVALGKLVTDHGETGIDTIVAVRHPRPHEPDQTIRVVSPCGSCRELICDYDPDARVIIMGETGPVVVPIGALLPNKYNRGTGL